jgi:hypothetical protein
MGGLSPGVFLDLAEHLARHRRGVVLTEQQVPQQARQRMTSRAVLRQVQVRRRDIVVASEDVVGVVPSLDGSQALVGLVAEGGAHPFLVVAVADFQ